MIPLPLGAVPWRLVGAALAGVVLAAALWRVAVWRGSHQRLQAVEAQLELERECGEGSACRDREAKLKEVVADETVRIVEGYEAELAIVRGRAPRVVRLCPDRGRVPVPGAASGADDPAAPGGLVPGGAGPDRGPELYALAQRADELAAQCRALQGWNAALAAPDAAARR